MSDTEQIELRDNLRRIRADWDTRKGLLDSPEPSINAKYFAIEIIDNCERFAEQYGDPDGNVLGRYTKLRFNQVCDAALGYGVHPQLIVDALAELGASFYFRRIFTEYTTPHFPGG